MPATCCENACSPPEDGAADHNRLGPTVYSKKFAGRGDMFLPVAICHTWTRAAHDQTR